MKTKPFYVVKAELTGDDFAAVTSTGWLVVQGDSALKIASPTLYSDRASAQAEAARLNEEHQPK